MSIIQIGSQTIFYDEHGAGHSLLLITGLGGSRLGWWKQIEPFAQRYRVFAMDNRDAGDSARAIAPYTIDDMANDAAGVTQNLGVAPAFVLGYSMGGFIALQLVLQHPELVDKLILVSTSAGGPAHVRPSPENMALLARDPNEDATTRIRRTQHLLTGAKYIPPEDLAELIDHARRVPMSLDAYQRQAVAAMAFHTSGVHKRLREIRVPTLVIHGDADPLVPYPNGQALASAIPNARLVTLAGVGHLPRIEATQEFNRAVIEFLG
ncbi:MAG: alpha/beta hydrolase [Chloroflexi bacterium]|nr:alpha/beta hydrolase [Chloroflexota bacterium]